MLFKTIKKTILMNKITKIMTDDTSISQKLKKNTVMGVLNERSQVFKKLYRHMLSMPGYSQILRKHNATAADLEKLSSLIQWMGYEYFKNDYLPVALVSFGNPLDFLLTHRQEILESPKTSLSLIDEAIKRLYT